MKRKKYQVFLSSTFEDLKTARRIAMEQVLNLGHIPVGMELFQAGNDSQWDYIQKRILECDYYILVIGDRYGSCLSDGMSYTEREYRFAAANDIPVASFLLSKEAANRLTRPNFETEPEKVIRLEAFRELAKTRMVQYWNEDYELSAKISSALQELIVLNDRPGLVPPGVSEDRLKSVTLNYKHRHREGSSNTIYDVISDKIPEANLEAQGIWLHSDDDTPAKRLLIEDIVPEAKRYRWDVESVFRTLFEYRQDFIGGLIDGGPVSLEDLGNAFLIDFAKKENIDLQRICEERGAKRCSLWSYGDDGLLNLIEAYEKAGVLVHIREDSRHSWIELTLAGRLLFGVLEKLPEIYSGNQKVEL